MRHARPSKLPDPLAPLQKRRLKRLWQTGHDEAGPLPALLGLPSRQPGRKPRRRS